MLKWPIPVTFRQIRSTPHYFVLIPTIFTVDYDEVTGKRTPFPQLFPGNSTIGNANSPIEMDGIQQLAA